MLVYLVQEWVKISICPLICWGGRRMRCLFSASCPWYVGKLSYPWESRTHYRNGMIPCIRDHAALIPAHCPLKQNHGTSQNRAPAFGGQPAVLNLSLVELPPSPLLSRDHSWLLEALFSSLVCVLTCIIGIFACMPCSLAPHSQREPWNAALASYTWC
jgi:hypothetical protein